MGDRKRRLIPLVIEPVSMPAWLYGIVGIDWTKRDPLVDPFDKLKATLGTPLTAVRDTARCTTNHDQLAETNMMVDHADFARQAFDTSALPPTPRTVQDALRYIRALLALLPAGEEAGYVKGPAGGENVTALPDGTLVRISRVMYPDGQIYKVMSDAPNGGPQWVEEDVPPGALRALHGRTHHRRCDPHAYAHAAIGRPDAASGPRRRLGAPHGAPALRVRGSQPADRGFEQADCGTEREAGAHAAAATGLHRAVGTGHHHLEAADMRAGRSKGRRIADSR